MKKSTEQGIYLIVGGACLVLVGYYWLSKSQEIIKN